MNLRDINLIFINFIIINDISKKFKCFLKIYAIIIYLS